MFFYILYLSCLTSRALKKSSWWSWIIHGKYYSSQWISWFFWFSKKHSFTSAIPISLHRLVHLINNNNNKLCYQIKVKLNLQHKYKLLIQQLICYIITHL